MMEKARDLIRKNRKAYKAADFPGATGNTTPPEAIFCRSR